jgi:hypothetical protein
MPEIGCPLCFSLSFLSLDCGVILIISHTTKNVTTHVCPSLGHTLTLDLTRFSGQSSAWRTQLLLMSQFVSMLRKIDEGGVATIGLYQPAMNSNTARRASAVFRKLCRSSSSHSRVAKECLNRWQPNFFEMELSIPLT